MEGIIHYTLCSAQCTFKCAYVQPRTEQSRGQSTTLHNKLTFQKGSRNVRSAESCFSLSLFLSQFFILIHTYSGNPQKSTILDPQSSILNPHIQKHTRSTCSYIIQTRGRKRDGLKRKCCCCCYKSVYCLLFTY